jgi:hypothetical protein
MNLFENLLRVVTDIVRCPIEAAMKSLRRGVIQMILWCGLLVISIILLLAGIGFILMGVYTLLVSAVGNAGLAALIVGLVVSLAAILMMVIIRDLSK